MHVPSRFETNVSALLADLERRVKILDLEIEEEEQRTKVNDVSAPDYSFLARNFRGRRDNLAATIAILKRQLGQQQAA